MFLSQINTAFWSWWMESKADISQKHTNKWRKQGNVVFEQNFWIWRRPLRLTGKPIIHVEHLELSWVDLAHIQREPWATILCERKVLSQKWQWRGVFVPCCLRPWSWLEGQSNAMESSLKAPLPISCMDVKAMLFRFLLPVVENGLKLLDQKSPHTFKWLWPETQMRHHI